MDRSSLLGVLGILAAISAGCAGLSLLVLDLQMRVKRLEEQQKLDKSSR
jgi:hypothetical protein